MRSLFNDLGVLATGWSQRATRALARSRDLIGRELRVGTVSTSHISSTRLGAMIVTFLIAHAAYAGALPPATFPNIHLLANGNINALARQSDGSIVLGGHFVEANGVPRSNLARLTADGSMDLTWAPSVDGDVTTIAVDANGDVYIGGFFTDVGGVARNGLAKISGTGAGTPDLAWDPSPDSDVLGIATDGIGNVYVAGYFLNVGGLQRRHLAKLSGASGAADPAWNPQPNDVVQCVLASDDGSVYVGGFFESIAGQPRAYLAKLSASGIGALDPNWNPAPDGNVTALALDPSGFIYVAGLFSALGELPRMYIGKTSSGGSGTVDADWAPSPDGPVNALAVDSTGFVYAGGQFSNIGGQVRRNAAKLDGEGNGVADPNWLASPDDRVDAISVSPNGTVALGGIFTQVSDETRRGFARVSTDGNPDAAVDVSSSGVVLALAKQSNGGMIVGGYFYSADGQPRNGILRLDPTGAVDSQWNPSTDGRVYALLTDSDDSIYVGGFFNTVDGQARTAIAKLGSDGALDAAWNADVDGGVVLALAQDQTGALFVSGSFGAIGGESRSLVAKLTADGNGSADALWNPSVNGLIWTLAVHEGSVFAGGYFSQIGGQPLSNLAKLSATGNGSADASWNPAPNDQVLALAVDQGSAIYAGGTFSQIGGQPRNFLAKLAVDGDGAADSVWNPSVVGGGIEALALDEQRDALYVGGFFESIGNASLTSVGRVATSGAGSADSTWNPGMENQVNALQVQGDAVYAGGYFTQVSGEARLGIAALPVNSDRIFSSGFDPPL
jgi:uncharacterized delta-60 repeat protein